MTGSIRVFNKSDSFYGLFYEMRRLNIGLKSVIKWVTANYKGAYWQNISIKYRIKIAAYIATGMTIICTHNAITKMSYAHTDAELPPEFLHALQQIIDKEQIDLDIAQRIERGKPWNSYHKSANFPLAIVYPLSTEEVSAIVKLCNKFNLPMVAYGGGTSLEGHTLTTYGGISVDFSRMNVIIELNEKDLDVTIQTGVGYIQLNDFLRQKGIWFPLDPGPGATVGGMVACRCSGSTAVRYGSMRDNVLSLTAVLPDGTIIKTGNRARKSSAGYDLTRLLVGSEGTLALVTEATLKLHCIPKVSCAMRITFPNGVSDAAKTAADTLTCGVTIGRCELLDETMGKIINQANPQSSMPFPEKTTLLYEVTGLSLQSVKEQMSMVRSIAESHGGTDVITLSNPEETKQLWMIRKECLWSAMSIYPDREPMITDVCVPLSRLAEIITQTKLEISKTNLPCPIIAHAGDGNFHVLIFFKPDDPIESAEAKRLANFMAQTAISMGGTCTGEHGVGVGKKELLKKEMGEGSMKLMHLIKEAIDPKCIMNPGKILDCKRNL